MTLAKNPGGVEHTCKNGRNVPTEWKNRREGRAYL